jgi:signal transduction histidine kinase
MKKILIIEDDKNLLESLSEVLVEEGFEIFTASRGDVGLDLLNSVVPDLIICDVMMPGMDGYEVLGEISKNETFATIPFIFLTARNERNDQRKAMDMGADDFLNKPFSLDELLSTIDIRLKKREKAKHASEEKIKNITKSISFSLPHELNTPLSGIIGFSEVLINEAQFLKSEEVKEMAGFINESALRLKKTIEKYLNYSKLQVLLNDQNERKLVARGEAMISNSFITAVLNKEKFDKRRLNEVAVDLEESFIKINDDYLALLISELIDNAIKFSRPNSRILVRGKKGVKNYWITIYDRGRGMSSKQLNEIGAFVQFNRDMFEQQGSGLGLAIVSNIVTLFGGTIKFNSEMGLGTTVTLEFNMSGV